jgi:rubredoxin
MPTPKNWAARIAAAQHQTTVNIAGTDYERTPNQWARCPDCAVAAGQLHVQSCDQERCPKCTGQLISCSCVDMDNTVH